MAIRVISGSAKGIRLKPVPGDTTRPVMDRVKEALFNILGREVIDAAWLDLFAGTGSVGIEALSRGARQGYFVELEGKAIHTIHQNLSLTHLEDRAIVRRADAFDFLRHPPPSAFDFVYIAPPQYKGLWQRTLTALDNPAWITEATTVIVQIDPSEQQDISLRHLVPFDERRYGNTLLWFFVASGSTAQEE